MYCIRLKPIIGSIISPVVIKNGAVTRVGKDGNVKSSNATPSIASSVLFAAFNFIDLFPPQSRISLTAKI